MGGEIGRPVALFTADRGQHHPQHGGFRRHVSSPFVTASVTGRAPRRCAPGAFGQRDGFGPGPARRKLPAPPARLPGTPGHVMTVASGQSGVAERHIQQVPASNRSRRPPGGPGCIPGHPRDRAAGWRAEIRLPPPPPGWQPSGNHRPVAGRAGRAEGGRPMLTHVSGFMLPALTACLRRTARARPCFPPPRQAAL